MDYVKELLRIENELCKIIKELAKIRVDIADSLISANINEQQSLGNRSACSERERDERS